MEKYIFVVCPSFHGATLLSCLLNNHPLISAMGDTIPRVEFIENDAQCSCGSNINNCEFWNKVINEINPDKVYRDGCIIPFYPVIIQNERGNEKLIKVLDILARNFSVNVWHLFRKQCTDFLNNYEKLFKLTCKMQGTKYFVGGQKNITQVAIVKSQLKHSQIIKVIHLIRDPRAAYYSNFKRYEDIDVIEFSRKWLSYHKKVDKLGEILGEDSFYQLRYEDLCNSPKEQVDNLLQFLGIEPKNLIVPSSLFRKKHVIGNQMIKTFDGTIKLDVKWKDQLSAAVACEILERTNEMSRKMLY